MSTLVEALPDLFLTSDLFFFPGLVVFAFFYNNIVAFISLAIVAFGTLWYIALTWRQSYFMTALSDALVYCSCSAHK